MSYMFDNVNTLRSINLNNFNTESATNMAGMFKDCTSVEYLATAAFVTDKVEEVETFQPWKEKEEAPKRKPSKYHKFVMDRYQ